MYKNCHMDVTSVNLTDVHFFIYFEDDLINNTSFRAKRDEKLNE